MTRINPTPRATPAPWLATRCSIVWRESGCSKKTTRTSLLRPTASSSQSSRCTPTAHYRLARLLESAGSFTAANDQYILARDYDGMPLRCIAPLENAYRAVAQCRSQAVMLVDGPAVLRAKSRHGILDYIMFHDNVHPNLAGHVAIAQAVLGGLKARGAFGWPASTPSPVLDLGRTAEEFGIDSAVWVTICECAAAACGWLEFPHDRSCGAYAMVRSLRRRRRKIRAGTRPEDTSIPGVGIGAGHS